MPSNRLYFPSMVERQLKESTNSGEDYFDQFIIPTTPQNDFMNDKTSIKKSFGSIIASVHRKLREKRLAKMKAAREAREAEPNVEPAKVDTPTPAKDDLKLKKNLAKSEMCLQKTNKNDSKSISNLVQCNTRSISQIKASCEQKLQQRMRRNIGRPTDNNNFTNQQRLKEVLRQKRILEDILCEHAKIQRDRCTIAHEIETMKNYLNDIRGKLDSSLKKLNKKNVLIRPIKPTNRPIQGNNNKNVSKIIPKRGNK